MMRAFWYCLKGCFKDQMLGTLAAEYSYSFGEGFANGRCAFLECRRLDATTDIKSAVAGCKTLAFC